MRLHLGRRLRVLPALADHVLPSTRSIDVIAFLPDRLLQTLRVVAAGRHELTTVATMSELDAALRQGRADCAVVDPQGPGRPGAERLGPLLARYPGVHVVVYTTLTADSMHDVAALGVRDVVLFNCDDRPTYFRDLLETAPAASLTDEVLARIEGALTTVRPELRRALAELFRAPETIRSVDAFRRVAGMSRMTLGRALTKAGLTSPSGLLRSARVVRVYFLVRRGGLRLKIIAPRLGYSSPRKLADECKALTGLTPMLLSRTVDPDEFSALIARKLLRHPL
jgi:AraC-like DNA-binding protein